MFEPFTCGTHVPEEVTDLLEKLDQLFEGQLVVTSLNQKEATFYVRNLTNEVVIRTLMTRKPEIFGSEVPAGGSDVLGPGDFQILSPLATQPTRDMILRYLPNVGKPRDYLSGFWYC